MSTLLWFDGALVDPDLPVVSALDHGFTVGDGVFETCEILDGQPFALTRHLRRLERSAQGLGLALPHESVLRGAVADVVAAWTGGPGRLRITVTTGSGPLGSGRGDARPTLVVAAAPARTSGPPRVRVVPWTRNERSAVAGLKSTSYAENVVALAWAKARGADEAIFANTRGELCEGTYTNVFVETGTQILTPPLDSGCLAGVTRELVLEWAAAAGVPVREARMPLDALRTTDHAALTSSLRGVVPVASVDDRDLAPGPLTTALAAAFAERRAADLDP